MTQEWICLNEEETARCAKAVADLLPMQAVVTLQGTLGAGKTAFCRALIKYVTGNEALDVPSPTYTLVQQYETDKAQIWHFDLYRLNDPDEIYDLGWEDAIAEGLCLIEWPERLGHLKPQKTIDISIDVLPNDNRRITLNL